MKKLKLILILFTIAFFSCKKEDDAILLVPMPMAFIGDMVVHLKWSDDNCCDEGKNIPVITPDVLEIFVSDEPYSNRTRSMGEVNFNEKSCTLDGFVNGKPFYIYLLAKKKGYESQKSEMIMVVPNKRKEHEYILQGTENQCFWDLAISPDGTKIAYVDNHDGIHSTMLLLTANIDGTNVQTIAKNSYKPSWSPDGTKIAFHTEDGESNIGNGLPSQIAIYDCNTKAITKLTSGIYHNCCPSFSDDGTSLVYQSDEDSHNFGNSRNIITLNLQTLSKKQYSAVRGIYEFPIYYFDHFLFSGNFLHSSRNVIGIHSAFDVGDFVTSFRNDYRPSLSPDKKRVAFISDRSGLPQVWVYEIETNRYMQVTGYDEDDYVRYTYTWTKINWIDDATLIFTLDDNKVLRQKI